MKNIAVFGGTFDPITLGHEAIIRRAADLFSKVYVAMCPNSAKTTMFDLNFRYELLKAAFIHENNIIPIIHNGLIADFAESKDAVIVKGLRYSSDFDYEHLQAESNYMISNIETVFLSSRKDDTFITSTLVRELIKANKDFTPYVSDAVANRIKQFIR